MAYATINGSVSAAGVRDISSHAPVDTNSVFRIASMTKSFTAASILMLRDEGKLSLDDPAERWVPELKGLRPTTDSPVLTIRMLLSHDTGWPEDNPWGDQQLSIADSTLSRMIKQGIPFSHAPNTAYEYSNYAFMILGRVVSKASGMPYTKFVQTRLLTPLGMTSSTLEVGTVPKDKLALGYRWEDATWKLEPQLPNGAGGPMGGMLVSPHDMGVWIANMLAAWPPRDGPETGPVRRASLREMQQMHRTRTPLVTYDTVTKNVTLFSAGYGFGLRIMADCRFAHKVAHAGGLPGFGMSHDLAAGVRSGAVRVRESDVHRLQRGERLGVRDAGANGRTRTAGSAAGAGFGEGARPGESAGDQVE